MAHLTRAKIGVASAAGAALLSMVAAQGAFADIAPATPSSGSSPFLFNAASSTCAGTGTRSLALTDGSGTPLSADNGLNATSGPAVFDTSVNDTAGTDGSGFCEAPFEVAASMSNLYSFTPSGPGSTTGLYECGVLIPSTAVTLAQPTDPLTLGNVEAALGQPQFSLAFNSGAASLSGLGTILGLLGVTGNSAGSSLLSGSLPTNPLSQTGLVPGLPTGLFNVSGTLAPLANDLPIQLTGLTTAPFAVADTGPGTCDTPVTDASGVPLMYGADGLTGLLNALEGIIDTATGGTAGVIPGSGLSVLGIDTGAILGDVLGPTVLANLTNPTGLLATALGLLSGGVTTVETDLVGAVTATLTDAADITDPLLAPLTETGSYSADSNLKVDTTQAPSPGSYEGTLYLTLLNT